LSDRLRLVEEVLRSCADGKPVIPEVARQLNDAVMAGTSAWRLTLHRSGSSRLDRDRLSAIGSLVGRLVDIAANLPPQTATGVSRAQAVRLADGLAEFRAALLGTGALRAADFEAPAGGPIPCRQIARTLQLLANSWTESSKGTSEDTESAEPGSSVLVPDAFTNPEHLRFAIRGCLAATVCYIVYNAVAWQGLSTAIATCMFTSLSTVGASRQKQTIRLAGAILGGVILGMGGQVFVFPKVDSIAGFALVFAAVSAVAAWFMTC